MEEIIVGVCGVGGDFEGRKGAGEYGFQELESVFDLYQCMVSLLLVKKNNMAYLNLFGEYDGVVAGRRVGSYGDKRLVRPQRILERMAYQTKERDWGNRGRRCPYRLSDHLSNRSTRRLFGEYVLVREARIYPATEVRTLTDRPKTNTKGFTVMKPVAKMITSKGICSPGCCGS